jgi:hypothetical protein
MSRFLSKPIILGMSLVELCLASVAITMPFNNNLNSYSIVAFSLIAFLSTSYREKISNLKRNRVSCLLPVLYFIVVALSFLWDQSPNKKFSYMETSSSLIVFPIVLRQFGTIEEGSIQRSS